MRERLIIQRQRERERQEAEAKAALQDQPSDADKKLNEAWAKVAFTESMEDSGPAGLELMGERQPAKPRAKPKAKRKK